MKLPQQLTAHLVNGQWKLVRRPRLRAKTPKFRLPADTRPDVAAQMAEALLQGAPGVQDHAAASWDMPAAPSPRRGASLPGTQR
jgi:hypothetical protein